MSALRAFETRDVEYLQVNATPRLARLYEPRGPGPFPALVDVHGGVWTTFDRLQNASIHEFLAARGVVVAALDFGMPPDARYPEPVAEINFGIRWLKMFAQTFKSHASLVGGLGTSSGAHQLMLNVLRPDDAHYAALAWDGAPDARLCFAVAGWGVFDPLARYEMARERMNARIVDAHDAYWPTRESMEHGNPQLLLQKMPSASLPPLLVIQGTNDANLPGDMAQNFTDAYRVAGGDVDLRLFDGQPHTFVTNDPLCASSLSAKEAIIAFIRDNTAPIVALLEAQQR